MPELEAAALGVFGILRDGIARLHERGLLGDGDATVRALSAWATLLGLAMLALDGQTAVTGARSTPSSMGLRTCCLRTMGAVKLRRGHLR